MHGRCGSQSFMFLFNRAFGLSITATGHLLRPSCFRHASIPRCERSGVQGRFARVSRIVLYSFMFPFRRVFVLIITGTGRRLRPSYFRLAFSTCAWYNRTE